MFPCSYCGLIRSSFRTNGVATGFILAATHVLLDEHAVHSWARLWFAGGLVPLAAGFHEQALTSLPVFALGIAWLSLKTEVETWRRTTLTIVAFVAPSLLLVSCFHIMNPIYGTGCASAGLLGELGETREQGSSQVTRYRLMNPGVVQEKTKMARRTLANTLKTRTQEKKIPVFAAMQEILIVPAGCLPKTHRGICFLPFTGSEIR